MIRNIRKLGDPVLRAKADWVLDVPSVKLSRLVEDLLETMDAAGGAGLAAPQIGESLRVVAFWVPAARASDGVAVETTVLVNPEIEILDPDQCVDEEGCLSVPGLSGMVPRPLRIRYSGLAPDGHQIEREASGFHARVVLHECDHLDGVVYLDRMHDLSTLGFVDAIPVHLSSSSSEDRE